MSKLVFLCSVITLLTAVSAAQSTWLVPSDTIIQKAISDGYAAKALPKDSRWNYSRHWISTKGGYGSDSSIAAYPPLYCALEEGQRAFNSHESAPNIESIKSKCLHRLRVRIVHYSTALDKHFSCVFQKGETTVPPQNMALDEHPSAVRFYKNILLNDIHGYKYYDDYWFELPATTADAASFIYADDRGKHYTLNFDFSAFAKDAERQY